MAEDTATTTTTTAAPKKAMKRPSKWMIGLILLVLVLGGLNAYQLKKNKELEAALKKKSKQGVDLAKNPIKVKDETQSAVDYTHEGASGDVYEN